MGRIPKSGPPDEKITINLGPVDLGMVDLLVEEGYFASRTDLIRMAIRRLIEDRQQAIDAATTRREVTVGFVRHDRASLEKVRKDRHRLDVKVLGVFELADDVDPDLADAAIDRLWVLGSLKATPAVLARLRPKIARGKGEAA